MNKMITTYVCFLHCLPLQSVHRSSILAPPKSGRLDELTGPASPAYGTTQSAYGHAEHRMYILGDVDHGGESASALGCLDLVY